ncbi:MAG: hypothetical protein L3J56_03240 [Bacteroidales bacterium]|nr:hypothetical protein [Bacteroidales bacterium]
MKKHFFLLFGIIITFSLSGYSQNSKVFTADSLFSELKTYYEINPENIVKDTILQRKDSIISVLNEMWISQFDKEERILITKVINYNTEKHFDKNTTFWYFIETIAKLRSERSSDFKIWLNYYDKLLHTAGLTSSKMKFFINGIYQFITDNYLMKIKSSVWKYTKGTYKFQFDNKKALFFIGLKNIILESYSSDGDTLRINNADGSFILLQSKFKGIGGNVNWKYFGYSPSVIKAYLKKYTINLHKNEYKADSVSYTNKRILDYPILGSIHDKASKRARNQGFYPVFTSYNYNYEVKSKQKNISFLSGIKMKGAVLKYVGSDSIKATAKYVKNGKLFFEAKSKEFSSEDSLLRSNKAAIALFIGKTDSITHPNVNFQITHNEFSFTRNSEGSGNLPFYDSYQKVYIKADNITWNTQDTLIRFYSKLGNEASLKSVDYFTKRDFTKLRMYELNNPLFDIKRYTRKIGSRSFYAQDYARFVRQSPEGVIHRLMGLWYEGFLDYNADTKYVTVKQKLFDYIKFFFDKKDYDVINIISKGVKRARDADLYPLINAVYNVKNNNLTVFGVNQVILNKRKKVGFVPSNKIFVIGKNRDMYFSGRLRTGMADFYGKDFYFNYENYDIHINKGDSLVYRIWDKDFSETSEKDKPVFLTSAIENISGLIQIDLKTNKSGAKNIPKFPLFKCQDTSYVYYDRRSKHADAYKRERFYFKNYPFKHDSLLYLTKYNLKIPGKMITGGIVPDFEDTLTVKKDYSLGFIHQTPKEGIDLFNGKVSLSARNSTLRSFIKLSNDGLVANGVAKWNNTTITTKDFNLYPDSLTALADQIDISKYINEDTYAEFPEVHGKMVSTVWDAVNDVVRYKTTKDNPVKMYDGKSSFEGEFEYRPKSLTGKGNFKLDEGIITADDFVFNKESLFSDKANISIKEKNSEIKDVIINNMKSFVDIKSGKAVFAKIKGEKSSVEFVNDKYISYPNHLVWHTGEGKINMGYNMNRFTNPKFSREAQLLDSAYLIDICRFDKSLFMPDYGNMKVISTDPGKDSLMFFGSVANYYTGNHKIIVKDVQKIIVADIVVTPSSDVIIDKNGDMEKLLKTTVKARGLHNISDVDIKISSSKTYVASSGIYQYEDMNGKLENINFDNITYDQQKGASVAHGFVEQYEKFKLNPWFDYYGDVYFNASKDRLRFEGFAKIIHSCNIAKPKWFYFKSKIDPDSIYLPLEPFLHSDLEASKARIYADIMSAKDSIYTFPVFLSSDPYGNSESILSVRDSSYYVTYSQNNNRYEITTLEKFNNRTLPGNYLDLNRTYCIVNGEGHIKYSKSVKINDLGGVGDIRYDTNSGEVTMQTLTYLDFFISKKALNILRDKLISNISLNSLRVRENSYKKPIYELLGVEATDKMLEEMSVNSGQPKRFPEKLNKTLVFTNLDFKWDPISKSYKSVGKIGVLSIGNRMINKYVNGHIQIKKRRTGDIIYIYLETAENEWFFFTFSGSIMRTISSVHEYNKIIEDLKTKNKRFKTDRVIYNYMLTNDETKNLFIYEFTGKHPAIDNFEDNSDDTGEENN